MSENAMPIDWKMATEAEGEQLFLILKSVEMNEIYGYECNLTK